MQQLETANRIDFNVGRENSDSRLSTKYLFSKARGKMFGVLTCYSDTKTIFLKAFSGQYNGIWNVEGWVPPLFDISEFEELNNVEEKRIKILSNKINQLENSSLQKKHLVNKRKKMSQALMKKIHNIYKIPNFHGIEKSLFEIFPDNTGIPTGTGDCCAPKLLAFAARNNLIPLGMTEFYWGLENKAQTRLHGFFYPACTKRCKPILGHMLCGLDSFTTSKSLNFQG